MKIYKPGTKVSINCNHKSEFDNIEGTICGVLIYADMSLQYEVVWWEDKTRTSEWLYPYEICLLDMTETIEIR